MAMNGVGHAAALEWRMGLVNSQGKYFTAETFGFKINASGTTMRKKQVWVIEHDDKDDDVVYVRSHLGRYLSADKRGNVTCESETKTVNEKFVIQYKPDSSGRWALKNKAHDTFFGGTEDSLSCNEKLPREQDWWTARLAIHPQVNLMNVNRRRYARLHAENDRVQCDRVIPWGEEANITIEFRDGKYAIIPCNNKYLHRDGTLVAGPSEDTLFTLEIKSGQNHGMALKDCTGRYLTAVGMDAVIKGRNKTISKDELFSLEDSHPQVFFTAHNGKRVSIKQGVDLSANQYSTEELSDTETFQIEFDKKTSQWRLRTSENKFWSLEAASGIQGIGNEKSGTGLFSVEWLDDGGVTIKASNGKYVTSKMNGSLYAISDQASDKERFTMTIINRPIIIFKCDFGFLGFKSGTNPRIECNKASQDIISVEHTNGQTGVYYLKGHNGKYYNTDADCNVNADSPEPQSFLLELRGQSRMVIKAPNGKYLKGEQNGIVTAKVEDISKATLWEY